MRQPGDSGQVLGLRILQHSAHQIGLTLAQPHNVLNLPLTDNRSAAFVADFDADGVQEMSIMTAGYPAEFGRKLGGVIEVQTARDQRDARTA